MPKSESKKSLEPIVGRTTSAGVEKRVGEVQRLLLDGNTRHAVLQIATERWSLGERQIDEYISKAWANIRETNKIELDDHKAVIVAQLWQSLHNSRGMGEEGNAIKALGQLSKILGLEKITMNHVLGEKRELESATDDDIEAIFTVEYDE